MQRITTFPFLESGADSDLEFVDRVIDSIEVDDFDIDRAARVFLQEVHFSLFILLIMGALERSDPIDLRGVSFNGSPGLFAVSAGQDRALSWKS